MLKFVTVFCILFFSVFLFAQEKAILRSDGSLIKYKGDLKNLEVQSNKGHKVGDQFITKKHSGHNSVLGTIDTLIYDVPFTTLFNQYGQDWMLQWFVAPADMNIQKVGWVCNANATGQDVEMKIVKVNWTVDELKNAGIAQHGYYEATGNGFNDITAFMDNIDITGGWVSKDGGLPEPFGNDIWSDGGVGYIYNPTPNDTDPYAYEWTDLSLISYPTVQLGDVFAVAIRNNDPHVNVTANTVLWYTSTNYAQAPAWKFYSGGRLVTDPADPDFDPGWWSREYIFDIALEVDLTGDRAPLISNVTSLGTTLSNADRAVTATITDDNPSGSTPGGVSSAVLQWSIDGGTTWNDVTMANTSGDEYSGNIPGQSAGTTVTYQITSTDDNSNTSTAPSQSYFIFQKQNDVLFIYNSNQYSAATGRRIYIGNLPNTNSYIADPVNNDVWLYSDGTSEAAQVMSLYHWVVQVDGRFPQQDFSDAAKAYLDGATAGDERNYFLSSQDYGCYLNGTCADITFAAGDYQYDYLGVETLGPQDLPGAILGVAGVSGDPISGWVDDYATANSVGYYFDPAYELAFTGYMDAMTPTSGATATFMSDGQVVGVRNEGANWKTAFIAFDYGACNFRSDTTVDHTDAGYAWGITVANQALKFIEWAGYISDVKPIDGVTPSKYSLGQNYPNPFNPTTSINYSIPKAGNVILSVYDVLGRKITSLVNTYQQAGSFNVTWDGTNQFGTKVTSGTYFYQLSTDNGFIETKKMILLK